jgi:hypothetical protein
LTDAKTERLIVPKKTEGEISSPDKDSGATGSAAIIGATAAIAPGVGALTDFNTDFSVQPTSSNLTDPSFANENVPINQAETQNEKITSPIPKRSTTNTRKYILALAIGGIFTIRRQRHRTIRRRFLMGNAPPKENNTTSRNTNLSQTPETTPSLDEKVISAEGGRETNSETNTNTVVKETQKTPAPVAQPTVSTTPKATPEQTPPSTPPVRPPPVNKTPNPQNAPRYVLCYVRSRDGTVNKIQKK